VTPLAVAVTIAAAGLPERLVHPVTATGAAEKLKLAIWALIPELKKIDNVTIMHKRRIINKMPAFTPGVKDSFISAYNF
jgi:hypothetical protein